MLVPLKWLNEYVKIDDIDPQEFADRMTMSGSKVEEVIETGKEIENVVTGRIVKIEKHPNAEKLVVCQMDVGSETIQIITGADNVREGQIVPVALHGSKLPGGVKIKRGKLRGLESNGMLCSAAELGLGEYVPNAAAGIYILPEDTKVGVDIKDVLNLGNAVIDFEITSNRPDCLSMIGMAREASVTFNRPLSIPEIHVKENGQDVNDFIDVEIKAKDLCTRYGVRIVRNVKIEESPDWMKERLKDAGVRPINNIVDITNYVMLEYGQPLHAFDYDKISGKKIIVRRAKDGENLKTLDGKDRKLDNSMLVIADPEKPLVVAGVMGGEDSEVTEKSSNILFETANFNGTSVRLTSKKLGFRTEASSRFEKGIDPNIALDALNRAAELVVELKAGEVVSGVVDNYDNELRPWTVDISPDRINRFLGTDIPKDKMVSILESLKIDVVDKDKDVMKAVIPTFRADIELEEDIAEEIARIYGYNNIESTRIKGEALEGGLNREQKIEDIARDILTGSGLYETITYSIVSPDDFDKINIPKNSALRNTITILNPLGRDLSIMRTTLIPSMLEVIARNYSKKIESAGFFELGRVYWPLDDKISKLPEEKNMLVIGMYGDCDFYDIKGCIELLLQSLGIRKYEFKRESDNATFHPGKAAKLEVKRKNIGVVGEIHPDIIERFDIPKHVYICELDFDEMVDLAELDKHFKPLPKYPSIERDMALLVDRNIMASEIEDIIREKGGNLIESIKLFDVYEGKQIPEGKKSIAYSIVYRSDSRTLKDDEVNKVHDSIIKSVESNLGAQLRL
ncbi:MAG TPA: phenylalanine--tRNA ligase subunit beta [Clostridiaceae bacterium]|nr:phenylalanine--tRNA ligase subunit beta [Clostridiaceae bacterium]